MDGGAGTLNYCVFQQREGKFLCLIIFFLIILHSKYNIYTGGAAAEDRREKPQTPKPKTETPIPIPTPEREMGKKREGQEKTEENRQRPSSSPHGQTKVLKLK